MNTSRVCSHVDSKSSNTKKSNQIEIELQSKHKITRWVSSWPWPFKGIFIKQIAKTTLESHKITHAIGHDPFFNKEKVRHVVIEVMRFYVKSLRRSLYCDCINNNDQPCLCRAPCNRQVGWQSLVKKKRYSNKVQPTWLFNLAIWTILRPSTIHFTKVTQHKGEVHPHKMSQHSVCNT
jgi:hypothetical protein